MEKGSHQLGIDKSAPPSQEDYKGNFVMARLDDVVSWARSNSLWPLTFGTSCCAIEMMMAAGASRHDISRFGAEVVRATPRQADLLIVAGTIVKRMAPVLRRLYEQMAEPRYVIATGACTISGGPFIYHSYSTLRGISDVVPVDVYVPGCPPRPEALFYAILTLQREIKAEETLGNPGYRRKPVMSALPPNMSIDEIKEEMEKLLKKDAIVTDPLAGDSTKFMRGR
jgi:NADH-quinone oxidoreductase subunit B